MFKFTLKSITLAAVLVGGIYAPGLSAGEIKTKMKSTTSKVVVSRQRINNDDWKGTQVTYADGSQHCYDEDNQMSCYGGCPCQ